MTNHLINRLLKKLVVTSHGSEVSKIVITEFKLKEKKEEQKNKLVCQCIENFFRIYTTISAVFVNIYDYISYFYQQRGLF